MPEAPMRIQRRRTRGYKTPPNTVYCGRPGPYGNEFSGGAAATAIEAFEVWQLPEMDIEPLRGKNLSCWCGLCEKHKDGKPLNEVCADCTPCHVDVLGESLYGKKGAVRQ